MLKILKMHKYLVLLVLTLLFWSCSKDSVSDYEAIDADVILKSTFGTKIDLENLANYANQPIPDYITIDNTAGNPITDKGATLGRVLFYDKKLSSNNTISCSSCHKQSLAFGDNAVASNGVNGTTTRHSMRLVIKRNQILLE